MVKSFNAILLLNGKLCDNNGDRGGLLERQASV